MQGTEKDECQKSIRWVGTLETQVRKMAIVSGVWSS